MMSMLFAGILAAALLWSPVADVAAAAVPQALLFCLVLLIAQHDMRTLTIPDSFSASVAVVGLAVSISESMAGAGSWIDAAALAVAQGLIVFGALLLVREAYFRYRGFDGLGLGDVKLAAAGGVLLGVSGFAWALMVSSIIGLLIVCLYPGRGPLRAARLPFGALLAPVCWLVWVLAP